MGMSCFFKGHDWVYGRYAEDSARRALAKHRKVFHNRGCSRCGKKEMHADEIEQEYEKIIQMRNQLGGRPAADVLCDAIEKVSNFDDEWSSPE